MTETEHGLASPDATLRRGAQRLAQQHPALDPRLVERIVFESHATLARGARVRDHLPPLALKFAADRLRALERTGGRRAGEPLRVLVESIRNDGISQMAAAYLNTLGEGRVEALSAALNPAVDVLRTVSDVMDQPFPVVEAGQPVESVAKLLSKSNRAVLMRKDGVIQGVVTRFDVLEHMMGR